MKATKDIIELRVQALKVALGDDKDEIKLVKHLNGWSLEGPRGKDIFGYNVYSLQELYDMIQFALRAIQIDREGFHSGQYWPSDKEVA